MEVKYCHLCYQMEDESHIIFKCERCGNYCCDECRVPEKIQNGLSFDVADDTCERCIGIFRLGGSYGDIIRQNKIKIFELYGK